MAVKYVEKEYVHEVKSHIVVKRYRLHEGVLADEVTILWGNNWSGVLRTHPGSATGTQMVEGFHSFWQSVIAMRLHAAHEPLLNPGSDA